jgi:hypothetical protein
MHRSRLAGFIIDCIQDNGSAFIGQPQYVFEGCYRHFFAGRNQ